MVQHTPLARRYYLIFNAAVSGTPRHPRGLPILQPGFILWRKVNTQAACVSGRVSNPRPLQSKAYGLGLNHPRQVAAVPVLLGTRRFVLVNPMPTIRMSCVLSRAPPPPPRPSLPPHPRNAVCPPETPGSGVCRDLLVDIDVSRRRCAIAFTRGHGADSPG